MLRFRGPGFLEPMRREVAPARVEEQKFLTFSLGEEDYGVPILQVHEVVRLDKLIAIPHAHEHMLGLMDLRGAVIPVVDLKRKLGIRADGNSEEQMRAIIVESGKRKVALAVDRVARVVKIAEDSIDQGPPTVRGSRSRHVSGVGKVGDTFIVLLDFHELFSADELAALRA